MRERGEEGRMGGVGRRGRAGRATSQIKAHDTHDSQTSSNREPKTETERDEHATSDKEMCFGMMQHPWHLGFVHTWHRHLSLYWFEIGKRERNGKRKESNARIWWEKRRKNSTPNSGRYKDNSQYHLPYLPTPNNIYCHKMTYLALQSRTSDIIFQIIHF
jgi:hypothetical protein